MVVIILIPEFIHWLIIYRHGDTSMNGFGGSDALTLIAGPFTSTTGQLRIHMLSTGSAAGSTRVFGNKHFIELSTWVSAAK